MQYFVLCYMVEKRRKVDSFTLYLVEVDFVKLVLYSFCGSKPNINLNPPLLWHIKSIKKLTHS